MDFPYCLSGNQERLRAGTRVIFKPVNQYTVANILKKDERYLVKGTYANNYIELVGGEGCFFNGKDFILQPWEKPGWSLPENLKKFSDNPLAKTIAYCITYNTGDTCYFGHMGNVFLVIDSKGRRWEVKEGPVLVLNS